MEGKRCTEGETGDSVRDHKGGGGTSTHRDGVRGTEIQELLIWGKVYALASIIVLIHLQ